MAGTTSPRRGWWRSNNGSKLRKMGTAGRTMRSAAAFYAGHAMGTITAPTVAYLPGHRRHSRQVVHRRDRPVSRSSTPPLCGTARHDRRNGRAQDRVPGRGNGPVPRPPSPPPANPHHRSLGVARPDRHPYSRTAGCDRSSSAPGNPSARTTSDACRQRSP